MRELANRWCGSVTVPLALCLHTARPSNPRPWSGWWCWGGHLLKQNVEWLQLSVSKSRKCPGGSQRWLNLWWPVWSAETFSPENRIYNLEYLCLVSSNSNHIESHIVPLNPRGDGSRPECALMDRIGQDRLLIRTKQVLSRWRRPGCTSHPP